MTKCKRLEDFNGKKFFNVFCLCLYWLSEGKNSLEENFVLQSKIRKVLLQLGVVGTYEVQKFPQEIYSAFTQRTEFVARNSGMVSSEERQKIFLSTEKIFILIHNMAKGVSRSNMVHHQVCLSKKGIEYAKKFVGEYKKYINKEDFLKEFKKVK